MRHLATILTVGLAASGVIASSWFPGTKYAYNKWHETELERWLSDHDIPYPKASDRKDLEALVEKNWNEMVVKPYYSWDPTRLNTYLKAKGKEVQEEASETKDILISQVEANWYETEEKTQHAWASVRDWILDTWTESQLKAFCDKHGIPVPQPRHRDTLLQKARLGYETAAKKAGKTAAYPGNWLYASWSESELKAWLDKHGIPAPQPTTRDKLIASVRRNSRLAYLKSQEEAARASASARSTYAALTDMIIDAWGESQLKDFCDKNGIPVPQGTKLNEIRAIVRKHRAQILGDTVGASASSAYGAATSNVRNQYAKATDSASLAAKDAFYKTLDKWPNTRLRAYLDARGIPSPKTSNADELRALVRKHAHKASTGWTAWTFDDISRDNLKKYLSKHGDAAAKKAAKKKDATRDELVSAAQSAYASASSAGGAQYASATKSLASATEAAKKEGFDTWTESDIKAYLDSYGFKVPQGTKTEELKAWARKQRTYFKYGTSSPSETFFAKLGDFVTQSWDWVAKQLSLGREAAQEKLDEAGSAAKAKVKETREDL